MGLLRDIDKVTWGGELLQTSAIPHDIVHGHCVCLCGLLSVQCTVSLDVPLLKLSNITIVTFIAMYIH